MFSSHIWIRVSITASVLVAVAAGIFFGSTPRAQADTFSITGTVYKYSATAGNVLQGANVMARNLDPMQSNSSAMSGMDGTFTITNLNPGTYALEVMYYGAGNDAPKDLVSPKLAPLTITNANSTGNTIVFERATNTVTGTVYRSDGTTILASAPVKVFSMTGGAFYSVTTNASGVYTQKVGGGDFMVKAEPEGQGQQAVDWVYQGTPVPVHFDSNDGSTQTVNFTTATANVTLTGTLKMPDGSAATSDKVFAMLTAGGEGYGQGVIPDSNGTFSLKVAPGTTYSLMIFPNFNNPTIAAPNLDPIKITSADSNTTKNLGNISMTTKTDTITVTVKDESNAAIANVQVFVMQTSESGVSEGRRMFRGSGFAQAMTNSSGQATLYVTPGLWSVRAMAPFGGGMTTSYAPSAPQNVTVTSGTPVTTNVTMKVANATITGEVTDTNGASLPAVYGFVSVGTASSGEFIGGLGASIQNGRFTMKVPAGVYPVCVYLSPGSGYSSGGCTSVTVAANGTTNLSGTSAIRLATNNATISGNLKDANGTTISNKSAQVYAKDTKGNFAFVTATNGSYTLKVAPGEWTVTPSIDGATGYLGERGLTYAVTATANQTTTQHIAVRAADATISGTVKNAAGAAVTGAYVTADSRGANIKKSGESSGLQLGASTVSDVNGNWTLRVPAGTYEVRAAVPLSQGLMNPQPQKVAPTASAPVTDVTLTFGTANATITGTASIVTTSSTTSQPLTYVTAFSDKGGYAEAQADSSGAYSLSVTNNDVWHLIAVREDGSTLYKSAETIVTLSASDTSATKALSMSRSSTTLPDQASVTCSATQTCTLALEDGTTVVAPSSALATSGNVTITATPKAQLPANKSDQPIGDYGIDFAATNDSGQALTAFNSPVSITMPYSDTALAAKGVTATDLTPKSWDTASGSWQSATGASVNATAKTVTYSTSHFTNFAITATAATVPTLALTSPATGTTSATASVTVEGTVSDPAATVAITVGSTDQGTVSVHSTTGAFSKAITLTGATNSVTITATNVVGTASSALTIALSKPTVKLTAPTTGTKVNKNTVDVTGTVSDPAATVAITVGSTDQGTVSVHSTTGAFSKTVLLASGSNTITVTGTNNAGAGTAATVSVENTGPSITKVTPTSVRLGTGKKTFKLALTGADFAEGATVKAGSVQAGNVTVQSSTKIVATFAYAKLKEGSYSIVVTNTDGSSALAPQELTVLAAKPKITAVLPKKMRVKKTGTVTVTIIGANFVQGTKVKVNGAITVKKVKFMNTKKLQITLQRSLLKAKQYLSITVITPDGQKATLLKAIKGVKKK